MQYRYTGPGPDVEPESGALIHPGDVWEFPEEPAFGLWEPAEAEGSEKPSEATESTPPQHSPPANEAENASTDASGPPSTQEA